MATTEASVSAQPAAAGIPTQLGHVALRVRNLDRAVTFYRDVVGLQLKNRGEGVAFLGARADASHEVALFQLPPDAAGPDQARVGLYHMAWEMPSFQDLEAFHQRLVDHNAKIVGYSPRQMNVMFHDPDGNELEAIWEPSAETLKALRAQGDLPRLKQVPVD